MTTATPKQLDFIAGLAAAKAIPSEAAAALFDAAEQGAFTKDEAKKLIDSLFGEADRDIPVGVHVAPSGPWEGQRIRVVRSKAGRLYSTTEGGDYLNGKGLFGLTAETLVEAPSAKPAVDQSLETGVYFYNDMYLRVQRSRTSGKLYAKLWSGSSWDYVGTRPMAGLTADHKLTAEQAAAFGHATGSCVFCARTLTDDRSVTVCYGPVCADTNGLPWGEAA